MPPPPPTTIPRAHHSRSDMLAPAFVASIMIPIIMVLLCFAGFNICIRRIPPRTYLKTSINPIVLIFTWPYHAYRLFAYLRNNGRKEKKIDKGEEYIEFGGYSSSPTEPGEQWEENWPPMCNIMIVDQTSREPSDTDSCMSLPKADDTAFDGPRVGVKGGRPGQLPRALTAEKHTGEVDVLGSLASPPPCLIL